MTTPTPNPNTGANAATRVDGVHAFTTYLASLVRDERRDALAALRRGLGKHPGQAAEMFPYVVPWLSDAMSPTRQADYFLVAALFASHQISWPTSQSDQGDSPESVQRGPTNLGVSFRRLASATDSASIEQRFVALLNAQREDLPTHLRHAISLLRAKDIPVDWARLLSDLGNWSREDRRVQSAWAQAFWRRQTSTTTTQPTESEAPITENS